MAASGPKERGRRLQPEFHAAGGRALHELKTIQYLEETVGPAGLRRLANALPSEDQRALVQGLRRRAASASLELESIIEDWNAATSQAPRETAPLEQGGLDAREIVETFIDVKRSSGELLRRAASKAPNEDLASRLQLLAKEEDGAATQLETLRNSL